MRGVSQQSLEAARVELEKVLGKAKADAQGLGSDLFAVTTVLGATPSLRRGLTDPARGVEAKQSLVTQLFKGKISAGALAVVSQVAGSRWSKANDLADATEILAVEATLAGAEKAGNLDRVEDELFRFSRIISSDVGLRDAFSARSDGVDRKGALVQSLLGKKVAPESLTLATQAATAPRGMRTDQVIERYVAMVAQRRQQFVAEVRSAVALTAKQRTQLAAALERIYGRAVQVHDEVDPTVVGGLQIQVAGETIDGSVLSRLSDVRRKLAS